MTLSREEKIDLENLIDQAEYSLVADGMKKKAEAEREMVAGK
jgi:hypothetical protein